MGRSKGGLTTKIHALVDANGLPILLTITPGQAADALRAEMEARGVLANVRLLPQTVRKPPFTARFYKLRNAVERFFSKIKHYHAIATRYEKHPGNYLALAKLAAAQVWMRFMSR